jgi:hypothetical protein
MKTSRYRSERHAIFLVSSAALCAALLASSSTSAVQTGGSADASTHRRHANTFDEQIVEHATDLFEQGRRIFRFDTFGDEVFWGGTLRLHEAMKANASVASAPV